MREKWIDAVKAIAVLFVLFGHAGVKIPYVSSLAVLFYVPVFFVLAGYLHHHRPEETFGAYAKKRAKRLLLPYFGYSAFLLLFAVAKEGAAGRLNPSDTVRSFLGIFYGVNTVFAPESVEAVYEPLLNIWNAPLWFLPALFLAELLFEGMLRLFKKNNRALLWGCIWCAVLGAALLYLSPVLLPWSILSVLTAEALVAAGWQLKRHDSLKRIAERPWEILLLFVAAGLLQRQNGTINISIGIWGDSVAVGLLGAGLASVGVMALMRWLEGRLPKSLMEGLCIMGQNTLPVLCLHLFVFMFVQTALRVFLPGFPGGDGLIYEAARIGMAVVSADIIVIGKLCLTRLCGDKTRK